MNVAPTTDQALQSHLETLKLLGFKAVRKHEKVERTRRRRYRRADRRAGPDGLAAGHA